MKFLKTSFLTAVILTAVMTLYPTFKDITESFQCLGRGRCMAMQINGEDSGEKIIFICSPLKVENKVKIFHLTPETEPLDITEKSGLNLNTLAEIFVNKNAARPLVLFDYYYTLNQQPSLFSFKQNGFITVPYQCNRPLENISFCTFNSDPTIQLISLKCLQESTERLLTRHNEEIFVDISDSIDLENVSDIAFNNNPNDPLALIIYGNSDKSPALFQLGASSQMLNISDQYPELQNLSGLEFAHLVDIEDKLYVYAVTLDGRAQFFCFDKDNHKIIDITHECGLTPNELKNIRCINLSNNLSDQLVCILYKNKQAKLFEFCHGIFTDITDTCEINKKFFCSVDSVELMQDHYGATIIINYQNGASFRIFHNPEMRSYTATRQIASAATLSAEIR